MLFDGDGPDFVVKLRHFYDILKVPAGCDPQCQFGCGTSDDSSPNIIIFPTTNYNATLENEAGYSV